MSALSDRETPLNRIGYAVATAKIAFRAGSSMEDDKKAINAFVIEFGRNIRDLVNACTAEYADDTDDVYLKDIENAINDDVDNTFQDAIDRRDDALSARQPSRRAVIATVARDRVRA